jgi:hypothetical protein
MLDQDYAAVVAAINRAAQRLSLVLGSPDQMFESDGDLGNGTGPTAGGTVGSAEKDDGWA